MPTPSTEQAVTVKGRVVKPYEVLSEMPPHRLGWVASADDGTYLCHDGQFLPKSLGTWPSMEACERFIREHQDPPASPPASEGMELPDKPGIWFRDGSCIYVVWDTELISTPLYQFWTFDPATGKQGVPGTGIVSKLPRGGWRHWHPASPPASGGAKELPDAPGVWTRNGRTLVVREMLDDPGTWRLRGFDANTGVEVEISEQWSPLKGGWRPASASPAGEHKDREEVERRDIESAIRYVSEPLAAMVATHKHVGGTLQAVNARLREMINAGLGAKASIDARLAELEAENASLQSRLAALEAANAALTARLEAVQELVTPGDGTLLPAGRWTYVEASSKARIVTDGLSIQSVTGVLYVNLDELEALTKEQA